MSPRTIPQLKNEIVCQLDTNHDGIARIDVTRGEADKLEPLLQGYTNRGYSFTRSDSVIVRKLTGKRRGQTLRIAIYPPEYVQPTPRHELRFETEDEARRTAERWESTLTNVVAVWHTQEPEGIPMFRCCRWVVQIWKQEDIMRSRFGTLTQGEIFRLLNRLLGESLMKEWHQEIGKTKGTRRTKTKAEQTRAEHRELYMLLREKHDDAKKEWLQRRICDTHPRRWGWKMRTVKANTADLK